MDDTRESLRRAIGDFAPRPDGYERVLRRQQRKHRQQRAVAAGVAIAIIVTLALLFARELYSADESPVPETPDLPSNSLIAFSATDGPEARGYYSGEVFLMAPGSNPQRLLPRDGNNRVCPAFAPDGSKLTYIEDPRDNLDTSPSAGTLMVVDVGPDGIPAGSPSPLMDGLDETSSCPSWSPDGTKIAMVRGGDELLVASLTGSSVTAEQSFHLPGGNTFPDTADVPAMAWAPDGSAIAAIHGGSVWLIRPAVSGDPTLLHDLNGTNEAVALAWSPDGGHLAIGDSTGDACCTAGPATLQILDVTNDSGTQVPLDALPKGSDAGLYGVTWLPDPDRIAIMFEHAVVVVDADGDVTPIRLRYRTITNGQWSPDGSQVVYTALDPQRGYAVVAQPIDGSPPVVLTPWGGDEEWADHFEWTQR